MKGSTGIGPGIDMMAYLDSNGVCPQCFTGACARYAGVEGSEYVLTVECPLCGRVPVAIDDSED